MKKIIAMLLTVFMVIGCAMCLGACTIEFNPDNITVGFIFLHDETSTYDKNFIDAATDVCEELGVNYMMITNIPEGQECYEQAVEFANEGCDIIFADSFGHEPFLLQAAREFPEIEFCHATGTQAHTAGLDNFHDAFASIYEGRYLAGIAAGMKLNDMIAKKEITADEAVMGYVGAWPYAEVKSGYTSFFLGARSVCPDVTMKVKFTNSWFDYQGEMETANALIGAGCKLISQHADSQGAPLACEEAGVPNVFYNGENLEKDTYLIASKINWRIYFKYMIECVQKGEAIAKDWTGTLENGAVQVLALNEEYAAAGTKEAIEQAKTKLMNGTLKVFDTSKFTVGGDHLTSYLADVDDNGEADFWLHETEAISNGVFEESKHRSAPYFDIDIDGITIMQ